MFIIATIAPVALIAQPAAAFPSGDPVFPFDYKLAVTTHIAKANQTIKTPPGVLKGGIDLNTGELRGTIKLPASTSTQTEAGIGTLTLVTAVVPVKPVTGHVNLKNLKTTSTSVFNIRIVSMVAATPGPLPLPQPNLVGNNCVTSTPVSLTMSGQAQLSAPSHFSGKFTIPPFKNCQAMTTAINQEIPGPGNTFSATATPE